MKTCQRGYSRRRSRGGRHIGEGGLGMASDRTLHTVAGRATALARSGSAGRRGYASRCECAMPTKMKVHDLVQTTNHTMCELKRRCATARLTARAERSCFRMSAPGCFHSTELKTTVERAL